MWITSISLALSCDGRVYGWGDNKHGQIGCGKEKGEIIATPIQLQTFIRFSVKQLKAFCDDSYALTTDGLVYSWGSNRECCLGHEMDEIECVFELGRPPLLDWPGFSLISMFWKQISWPMSIKDMGLSLIWNFREIIHEIFQYLNRYFE